MHARKLSLILLLAAGLLSGCAAAPPPPLLGEIREIRSNGELEAIPHEGLSPFQRMLRSRIPASGAESLLALEILLPAGTGHEGAYMAILQVGNDAELRYFEQRNHLPRADRFFRRTLGPQEVDVLRSLLKEHPLASLADFPATPSNVADSPSGEEDSGEMITEDLSLRLRLTQAGPRVSRALTVDAPGPDHPAMKLVRMFAEFSGVQHPLWHLGGAGGAGISNSGHPVMQCRYHQPIPATASILYAHPRFRVIDFWIRDSDLRVAISPIDAPQAPVDVLVESEENPPTPEYRWLNWKENRWQPGEPPPIPTDAVETEEATERLDADRTEVADSRPSPAGMATEPPAVPAPQSRAPVPVAAAATAALVPMNAQSAEAGNDPAARSDQAIRQTVEEPSNGIATMIPESRFSNPGLLPEIESWWAEPGNSHTMVWHYQPIDDLNGITTGFVVPALRFDNDHAAINREGTLLYILYDGLLFSLPIPLAAQSRR